MNNYIKKANYTNLLQVLRNRGMRKVAAAPTEQQQPGNWEVTPGIRTAVNMYKQAPAAVNGGLQAVDTAKTMTGAEPTQHAQTQVPRRTPAPKKPITPNNQSLVNGVDTVKRVTSVARDMGQATDTAKAVGTKLAPYAPGGKGVGDAAAKGLSAVDTLVQPASNTAKFIDSAMNGSGLTMMSNAAKGKYSNEAQAVDRTKNPDGDFRFGPQWINDDVHATVKNVTNIGKDAVNAVKGAVDTGTGIVHGAQTAQQWLTSNPQAKEMVDQAVNNINNNPALSAVKKTLGATGGVLNAVGDLNELAHDPSFMNLVDATGSAARALELCGVTAAGPVAAAVGTFTTSKELTEALVNHYNGIEQGDKFVDNYAENNLKNEDGTYRDPSMGDYAYMVGGHMANQAGAVANGVANDAAYFWNVDKNMMTNQAIKQIEENERIYNENHPRAPEYNSGRNAYTEAVKNGEDIDPNNPAYSYFFNQQPVEWRKAALQATRRRQRDAEAGTLAQDIAAQSKQQAEFNRQSAPLTIPATNNGDIDQNKVMNNAMWGYDAPEESDSPFEEETYFDRAADGASLDELGTLAKSSEYILTKSLLSNALRKKF